MIGVSQISVVAFRGGGGAATNPDFISTWDTTKAGSASDTVVLPLLSGGTYSGSIDWGDGNTSTLNYANRTHVYASSGTYTITITATTFEGWRFNNSGDKAKIIDISNWGTSIDMTEASAFYGCSNLDVSATDAPILSSTLALNSMFRSCSSLTTPDFSAWDTSNQTNLRYTFYQCPNFNGNISTWDTSNVTTFTDGVTSTFRNCTSFNSDISGWSFASTTDLSNFLSGCQSFNQDVSNWDMSTITDAGGLFNDCFDFDNGGSDGINNWDVSNIQIMGGMFRDCQVFNRNIGGWDTSSVTTMLAMFTGCTLFNKNIGNWNTSNVTSMLAMFTGCTLFNQDISGWDVSSVTTFGAVGAGSGMFRNASSFNQPIGAWTTTALTDVGEMFAGASSFDQDLSNWDIDQVDTFGNTFNDVTLSTSNYDAMLVAWEAQLQTAYPSGAGYPHTINIHFGNSQYTLGGAAEAARTSLISTFGWTITDGGGV